MLTLNKKFAPLVSSPTRYFVITGGRGSAKSFSVNTFLCLLLLEIGHRALFLRQTLTSAYLSIIPEFQEKIELLQLNTLFDVTKTEITCKRSLSDIMFRGIQTGSKSNTANLKSLQGITTLVIDEAEEVTDEATFDKIDLSVRQKGVQNRVILILNPTTKESWIYRRFFEQAGVQPGFNGIKGNVTYIHTDYRDNIQHLDESFIEQIEHIQLHNPVKYEHAILGGWLDKAEGVVYSNWELGEFKEVTPIVYGQDYGFAVDPTTLIATSVDKANKRIYLKELMYKPKLTTSEIAAENVRLAGKGLIYADSAEPRLITELVKLGCNVKGAIKGQGSVSAGIALLQDYRLVVDPGSTNLVKELNNYEWNDRKSGTPIDAYNHLLDAARYAITPQMKSTSFSYA